MKEEQMISDRLQFFIGALISVILVGGYLWLDGTERSDVELNVKDTDRIEMALETSAKELKPSEDAQSPEDILTPMDIQPVEQAVWNNKALEARAVPGDSESPLNLTPSD